MAAPRAAVRGFRCSDTGTITYVVARAFEAGCAAAVIDPVLSYDPVSGRTSTPRLEPVRAFVAATGLRVSHVLDTHVHADHLSGVSAAVDFLGPAAAGARRLMGARITDVQRTWVPAFGTAASGDGAEWDGVLADGARFDVGGLPVRVVHTPGHTPACVTCVVRVVGAKDGTDTACPHVSALIVEIFDDFLSPFPAICDAAAYV